MLDEPWCFDLKDLEKSVNWCFWQRQDTLVCLSAQVRWQVPTLLPLWFFTPKAFLRLIHPHPSGQQGPPVALSFGVTIISYTNSPLFSPSSPTPTYFFLLCFCSWKISLFCLFSQFYLLGFQIKDSPYNHLNLRDLEASTPKPLHRHPLMSAVKILGIKHDTRAPFTWVTNHSQPFLISQLLLPSFPLLFSPSPFHSVFWNHKF